MSLDLSQNHQPICSKTDLLDWFFRTVTKEKKMRIGVEHEMIAFHTPSLSTVTYASKPSIKTFMERLNTKLNWTAVLDQDDLIGLNGSNNATISLEPGGQFELSGEPKHSIHEVKTELLDYHSLLKPLAKSMKINFLTLGLNPSTALEAIDTIPKERYAIMARYMPRVGTLGLRMMHQTATAQVNMDYESESDMRKKMRASICLQPIVTAIFANSPILEQHETGYLSYRAQIWKHTDPHRTGVNKVFFEPHFGFEQYVDFALNVPMYFIKRDNTYIDCTGFTFQMFLEHRIPHIKQIQPTIADWESHLSTIFTEARLKSYIEQRGADLNTPERILGLSAFWTGLLYDSDTLDQVLTTIQDWTYADLQDVLKHMPRLGLTTPFKGSTLSYFAKQFLVLSRQGLTKRNVLDDNSQNETHYLNTVESIVNEQLTPAENVIKTFRAASIKELYSQYALFHHN